MGSEMCIRDRGETIQVFEEFAPFGQGGPFGPVRLNGFDHDSGFGFIDAPAALEQFKRSKRSSRFSGFFTQR